MSQHCIALNAATLFTIFISLTPAAGFNKQTGNNRNGNLTPYRFAVTHDDRKQRSAGGKESLFEATLSCYIMQNSLYCFLTRTCFSVLSVNGILYFFYLLQVRAKTHSSRK